MILSRIMQYHKLLLLFFVFLSPILGCKKIHAFSWTQNSLIAVGLTTGSFFLDDEVRDGVAGWNHDSKFLNKTMALSERYGGAIVLGVGFLSYPMFSLTHTSDSKLLKTSKDVFYAMSLYTLISTTLKFTVGRHRPYQTQDSLQFTHFSSEHSSFPSGHTGAAFAFSTAIALNTSSNVARTFLWTTASLVGLARIYEGKHWLSDTIAAAALGTFSAVWVHHYLQTENNAVQASNHLWMPLFENKRVGVGYVQIWN